MNLKTKVSDEWDGKRRTLYRSECSGCDSEIWRPKHVLDKRPSPHCSRACFNENSKRRIVVACGYCEEPVEKTRSVLSSSKSGLLFCNRKCKEKAQCIEGGLKSIQPNHYKNGEHSYRGIAFREYPHCCNSCGYDSHKEVLEVHHRDRNRSNNNKANLEILCPTCHAEHHFLEKTGRWGS